MGIDMKVYHPASFLFPALRPPHIRYDHKQGTYIYKSEQRTRRLKNGSQLHLVIYILECGLLHGMKVCKTISIFKIKKDVLLPDDIVLVCSYNVGNVSRITERTERV